MALIFNKYIYIKCGAIYNSWKMDNIQKYCLNKINKILSIIKVHKSNRSKVGSTFRWMTSFLSERFFKGVNDLIYKWVQMFDEWREI